MFSDNNPQNAENNYKVLPSPRLINQNFYIPQTSSYYQNQQNATSQQSISTQHKVDIDGAVIKYQCVAMIIQCFISALLDLYVIKYDGFLPVLLLIFSVQFIICLFFLFRVARYTASTKVIKYFKAYLIFLFTLYFLLLLFLVTGLAIQFIFPPDQSKGFTYFYKAIGIVVGIIFVKFGGNYLIRNKVGKN